MLECNLLAFAAGGLLGRQVFVLQWPSGAQQLFAPGHMKYCSHEMHPPQTSVVTAATKEANLLGPGAQLSLEAQQSLRPKLGH